MRTAKALDATLEELVGIHLFTSLIPAKTAEGKGLVIKSPRDICSALSSRLRSDAFLPAGTTAFRSGDSARDLCLITLVIGLR